MVFNSVNEEIFKICMNHGFDFFSTLPGSYNVDLIERTQKLEGVISVPLVREESGVSLSAGAYLGGRKTAMVIQNQGLGNMEGQLLVLNSHLNGSYRFPNLYIISHRGLEGDRIQAQKPMGLETARILDKPGIKQCSIEDKRDIKKADQLLKEYDKGYTIALTVKPDYDTKKPEKKLWENVFRRMEGFDFHSLETRADMERYEAFSTILKSIENEFVVSNIGFPSRELYNIKDRARNFYLTSSLGQSYMLALGLALSTDDLEEKIVCFEGDGGLLMNLGSLAVVAKQEPRNFLLVLFDNGVYGTTKNVSTYTSEGINLSLIALACGFSESKVFIAENKDTLDEALEYCLSHHGPLFIHVLIKPGNKDVSTIPIKNVEIKKRFMEQVNKAYRSSSK